MVGNHWQSTVLLGRINCVFCIKRKRTGLFHCHSALQSENVSGAKSGDTIQMAVNTRTCCWVCMDHVLATFNISDSPECSEIQKISLKISKENERAFSHSSLQSCTRALMQ